MIFFNLYKTNNSSKSILLALWMIYCFLLVFSTQAWARVKVLSFSFHPSLFILGIIVIYSLFHSFWFRIKSLKYVYLSILFYILVIIFSPLISGVGLAGYSTAAIKIICKWGFWALTIIFFTGFIRSKTDILIILKCSVLAMVGISAYGMWYWIFIDGAYNHLNPFWQIASQNALSNWTAGIFILAIFLADYSNKWWEKAFWTLGLIILICAQVFTLSRFGWVVIALSLILYLLYKHNLKSLSYVLFILICFSAIIYFLPQGFQSQLKRRVCTISNTKGIYYSMVNRLSYAKKAVEIFSDNFFTGVGIDNFSKTDTDVEIQYDPRYKRIAQKDFEAEDHLGKEVYILTENSSLKNADIYSKQSKKQYSLSEEEAIIVVDDDFDFESIKKSSSDSHGLYLDIISETGFLGMVCFLYFLLMIFVISIRAYKVNCGSRDKDMLVFLYFSVLLYLTRGITSDEVLFMPITPLIFAFAISYSASIIRQKTDIRK